MLWAPDFFGAKCDWSSILGNKVIPHVKGMGDYLLLGPKESCDRLPRLLVVPPASGHPSTLMADLVAGFTGFADIHILHLLDPEFSPKGSAQFGVQGQVLAISQAIKHLRSSSDRPIWCITACQASGPTLSAIAQEKPDALALIASPIKPSESPGGAASMFADGDSEVLFQKVRALTKTLSNGRCVLPASVQMTAILHGQGGAARILAQQAYSAFGPATFFQSSRQLANRRRSILTQGQNIDARLLEEALRFNFIDRPFDAPDSDLRKMNLPILAIGGGEDKVVPAGQCHAVRQVCPRAEIEVYTAPRLDHFDLFVGDQASQQIGPKALSFFTQVAT